MEEKKFAGVVVNKKTATLNRIFYYSLPPDLAVAVQLGQIVEVEFGRQRLEAIVVELTASVDWPAEKIKPLRRIINAQPLFGADLLALSHFAADYYLCSWVSMLQAMLPAGMYLTGKMPRAQMQRLVALSGKVEAVRGAKQKQVLAALQAAPGGVLSYTDLQTQTAASYATVRSLAERGLVQLREEMVWPDEPAMLAPTAVERCLSEEQAAVLAQIQQNFNQAGSLPKKPVLLHGVTGSGKTEIYLRLAEETRRAGKQSIILVPEIALTPQTVRVFQHRFGRGVAVLHSGLTGAERRAAWLGIAQGRYDLIIGARSAIFAPTPNLGLLVIDEEHEASYKQDNAPRFHTRVLAQERCRLTGAGLILGSATPDVETRFRAQQGEYLLCEMPHRLGGHLPDVQLVDMSKEFRDGNNSIFSRILQQKLYSNWQAGRQSLLFLNRRGYESFVSCRHCGYVVECPHCSVAMAYHIGDEAVKCHYCGQTLPVPSRCPHCGSAAIRFFGAGTQKLAEAVQKLLPQARIARLDRDVTEQRGRYEQVYQAMLDGQVDILVGTQMIAKGLDFPRLTLVGVIAADIALHMPDLRSGERAFQLTCQVAGRAGRALLADGQVGEVIVQTYQPESDILQAAARQDYAAFYQQEILRRKLAAYPPFTALIRLVISAEDLALAWDIGRKLAYQLQMGLEQAGAVDTVQYWGPKPCAKAKIKDRHRLQILLKGDDLTQMRAIVRQAAAALHLPKQANLAIDVEPLNLL